MLLLDGFPTIPGREILPEKPLHRGVRKRMKNIQEDETSSSPLGRQSLDKLLYTGKEY